MHVSLRHFWCLSLSNITNISNCVLLKGKQSLTERLQITNCSAIKRILRRFPTLKGSGRKSKRFIFVYEDIFYQFVVGHSEEEKKTFIKSVKTKTLKNKQDHKKNHNHLSQFMQSHVINTCSSWIQFSLALEIQFYDLKIIRNLYSRVLSLSFLEDEALLQTLLKKLTVKQ